MVNKKCEMCSKIMNDVHFAKKYCDDCKKEVLRENQKRHFDRHKDNKKKQNEDELKSNFDNVITNPFDLTGKGFNLVSEIKCKAYTKFLDKKWVEILKDYNVFENLLDYIVNSYLTFIEETGRVNLHEFAKWNKYCSYDLLIDVGIDEIKNKANIRKLRYSDEEFIDNINEVLSIIGNPPLYNEFEQHSKISLNTYALKYNLKGKVYQKLMKIMLTDDQYETYLIRYKNHKSNVGKETGILSAQYNDKDYEDEFHRTIKYCFDNYDGFPSRRLFQEISNIDISAYRGKYNKSWLDICEMYGYKVERNHKLEKLLLNLIKDITGMEYTPQKTWDWLIGTGGKHMYCDGYYNDLNLVIEFDGSQHRKPVDAFGGQKSFIRLQQNDRLKETLLNENDIKLIRIASNTKWHDREYIQIVLMENNIPVLAPTNL